MRNSDPALNGASSGVQAVPRDLADKCKQCREMLFMRDLEKTQKICPRCGYHFRLTARERVRYLVDDPDQFRELDGDLRSSDPLKFVSLGKPYAGKLKEEAEATQLSEAVVVGMATIKGQPVSLAVMDFNFIGGSMGIVVGERLTRAIERAVQERCGLVIVASSGGARMQESVFALYQMAKTSAALTKLAEAGQPFISVMTDPTTGGVTASFASLGDVILAEPGALIGFAGPRVIEQSLHIKLPSGTDTAEFMVAHGMLDAIVDRRELPDTIGRLLRFFAARG